MNEGQQATNKLFKELKASREQGRYSKQKGFGVIPKPAQASSRVGGRTRMGEHQHLYQGEPLYTENKKFNSGFAQTKKDVYHGKKLNIPVDKTDKMNKEYLQSEITMNNFMNQAPTEATIYPRQKPNPIVQAYRKKFDKKVYPWEEPQKALAKPFGLKKGLFEEKAYMGVGRRRKN